MGSYLGWILLSLSCALIPFGFPIARNLEYEYYLIHSILFLIISPWFYLFGTRLGIKQLPLGFILILVPLIPFLISMIGFATESCRCSMRESIHWFFIQSLASYYTSLIFIVGVDYLSQRYSYYKTSSYLLCSQLAVALFSIAIFWFLPQKRMIHFFVGFIHGPIYDRWIPIDSSLIFTRALQALVSLSIFLAYRGRKLFLPLAICLSFVLLPTSWMLPENAHGLWALKKQLTQKVREKHFTIYHSEKTDVRMLVKEARFHIDELRRIMEVTPDHIHIFAYDDEDQKKRLFGGNQTDITDVVTPSIHIINQRSPHPSLRHELVHAISAKFAFYGLGFHPNMLLTEGLAVALAPEKRTIDLDQASAMMLHQNRLPPMQELMGPSFWLNSGARAYTAAGSLLRFISENFGFETLKALYSGEDRNLSLKELIAKWKNYLISNYPDENQLVSEALFREAGVWKEKCPHSKASLARDSTYFWSESRQPRKWKASRDYLRWLESLEADKKIHKLNSLRQQTRSLVEAGEIDKLKEVSLKIMSLTKRPAESIEDIELELLQSDIEAISHNFKTKPERLSYLETLAKDELIGASLTRQIQIRGLLWESEDQKGARWLSYIAGWEKLPNTSTDSSWAALYLANFRLKGPKASLLLDTKKPDLPLKYRGLLEFWYYKLGERLLYEDDYVRAQQAFEAALAYSKKGSQAKLEELIRWLESMKA